MATKVIFLDIDGVICCNMMGRLEDNKMMQLRRIVEATGAKIVLSTDWRRQAQLKRQVIMACKRCDMEVIGATPQRSMYTPVRPMEILDWLNANRADKQIGAWIAIDDRNLVNEIGGRPLNGHFVHTHPSSGLTATKADLAIQLLDADSNNASAAASPSRGGGALEGGAPGSAAEEDGPSKMSQMCTPPRSYGCYSPPSAAATSPSRRQPVRAPAVNTFDVARGVGRLNLGPSASSFGSPQRSLAPSFACESSAAGLATKSVRSMGSRTPVQSP